VKTILAIAKKIDSMMYIHPTKNTNHPHPSGGEYISPSLGGFVGLDIK
jgi:hypothetical protein